MYHYILHGSIKENGFHHLFVPVINKLSHVTKKGKTFPSFNKCLIYCLTPRTYIVRVLRVSRECLKHFLECLWSVWTNGVSKKYDILDLSVLSVGGWQVFDNGSWPLTNCPCYMATSFKLVSAIQHEKYCSYSLCTTNLDMGADSDTPIIHLSVSTKSIS